MLTTELCARLCADFLLQLPDAPACFACTRVVLDPWDDAEGGTVFIGERLRWAPPGRWCG